MYLNPDNKLFADSCRQKYFVDKTALIGVVEELYDTYGARFCVSRPRRFGKSMASDMLAAFYSKGCDSRSLFADLKIAQRKDWDCHLNRTNVIKVDFGGLYSTAIDRESVLPNLERAICNEIGAAYSTCGIGKTDRLADVVGKVHEQTGETFGFIFDEYDTVVRLSIGAKAEGDYIDFLNGLFKNTNIANGISFCYLTGILPIVKETFQSKLNNFRQYTVTMPMETAQYFGFTEEETRAICAQADIDPEECLRWYDGYNMGRGVRICNPQSVIMAAQTGEFASYWSNTGSYETIKAYIDSNFSNSRESIVDMLADKSVRVSVNTYLGTVSDFSSLSAILTYLIHLGYLTYDRETKECKIPNEEIREEWITAIESSKGYEKIVEMIYESDQLLAHTIKGDGKYVAESLRKAHEEASTPLTYNNESSLQSAMALAYMSARSHYTAINELPAGEGFADMVLIPHTPSTNRPAIIFEFKVEGNSTSAESCKQRVSEALKQISNRRYANALELYKDNLLFVGIAYNKKSKEHVCEIRKL